MKFTKSSNPMFSEKTLAKFQTQTQNSNAEGVLDSPFVIKEKMTVAGGVNKAFILGVILLISALFSYTSPLSIYLPLGALGAAASSSQAIMPNDATRATISRVSRYPLLSRDWRIFISD